MTVDSGSLVSDAYDWLLSEIVGFRFNPGTPLSENKIAEQLGISRTPIREALLRLETEGLVRRTANARFAVAQPSSRDVNEACDLLEVLDVFVFTRAADKLTPPDVSLLLEYVAAMRDAAARGDKAAWSEADAAFHSLVNRVSDNRLVATTGQQVRRRIQRFWMRAASPQSRLEACSTEHLVLAQAMANSDMAGIELGVAQHVGHMRSSILASLESAAALWGDELLD